MEEESKDEEEKKEEVELGGGGGHCNYTVQTSTAMQQSCTCGPRQSFLSSAYKDGEKEEEQGSR